MNVEEQWLLVEEELLVLRCELCAVGSIVRCSERVYSMKGVHSICIFDTCVCVCMKRVYYEMCIEV